MEMDTDAGNKNANRNLLLNVQNPQEESPHHSHPLEGIFSRENVKEQDEEENYREFLRKNPPTSQTTNQKVLQEKETIVKRKSESPQIEREASSPDISSPKKQKTTENETQDESKESKQPKEVQASTETTRVFSSISASAKSSRDETAQKQSSSSSEIESVLYIPEIYRKNYGFTNNWELENCTHARDFWYDSEHSTVRKFLIRFYDDNEYQKEKLLHVQQQKFLEDPKIKYKKLRLLEKKFEKLQKKVKSGNGFRLFVDVRDFKIFDSKMTSFFNSFGHFVTHFSFGRRLFSSNEVSASQLLSFILEKFPNLEYLAINDGMLKKIDQTLEITTEKKLEKLKTVRLMTISYRIESPLIIELLLHAPALEKIYGVPLHCLYEIQVYFEEVGNSKLPRLFQKLDNEISMDFVKQVTVIRCVYDKLKHCSFHCNPKNFFSDVLTLHSYNPALEVVDARTFFMRHTGKRQICANKFIELLHSIQTHVKSLSIEPFQQTNFPRLENLHSLNFDMDSRAVWSTSNFGYFPPGFDLPHKFPQLKVVQIEINARSSQFLSGHAEKAEKLFHSHFPRDVFRPLQTFDKVKRLNLLNFAPPSCIPSLQELFPRITVLQLTHETAEMSNVLPEVYKFWPRLRQLILNFAILANFNLDPAFTGISFTKCRSLHQEIQKKLKSKSKSSLKLDGKSIRETIKKYKTNLSIRDLKDLFLLKMVLNVRGVDKAFGTTDYLMTPVSGIYGFGPDHMAGCKVVLGFDERMTTAAKKSAMRLLNPMKPYLTIDD